MSEDEKIILDENDEPIELLLDPPRDVTVSQPVTRGVPFNVAWTGVAGAMWYNVYYQGYSSDTRVHIGNTSSTITNVIIPTSSTYNSVRIGVTAHTEVSSSVTAWSYYVTVHDQPPPNQPPTTPPSITVPSTIYRNTSFTVSWGASTNPGGGSVTYYLERQINGGSWTALVNGTSALNVSTSVPTEATSVAFRVRSKNASNVYSDWKTSPTMQITNRPPTTPPSITIPTTIRLGAGFTVSWGASTDPDGDSITYQLDRQTNGGAWAFLVSITATNYQQMLALDSGITSVAYRVRARDAKAEYSSFQTSATRTITPNRPPTMPSSITIPDTIMHNQQVPISWGASTDPDGDAITYELWRYTWGTTNTNTRLYQGTGRAHTDSALPTTATSVRYDVFAKDNLGAQSPTRQSPVREIIRNVPPQISGQDRDIGIFNDSVSYMYTVTDGDNDEVTVVEKINNTIIRSYKVELGAMQQLLVENNDFTILPNGKHTLTITATDVNGTYAIRTLTFTKQAVSLSVMAKSAVPVATKPHRMNVVIHGHIPAGSWFRVFVTNNGLDDAPIWEDATQSVASQLAHVFQNDKKRSARWGVNAKVIVHRGDSIELDACYLSGVTGNWE